MNEDQFRATCAVLLAVCVGMYGAWILKTWQAQRRMQAQQDRLFNMAVEADIARRVDNG